MAVAAASGRPLWGLLRVDEPTEVAYFFAEDDERLAVQRIEAICRFMKVDEEEVLPRIHATEAVPKFGDPLDLDVVRRELDVHPEIRFTVIDPLYRTTLGADGRALYDIGGLLGAIQQVVVNEARSGLIIGHHWNEAGRGTGPERMAGAGPAEWGRVLFSHQLAFDRGHHPLSCSELSAPAILRGTLSLAG